MTGRKWTKRDVEALGLRTDLETGASVWGIGRTRAYELARTGQFPSPVVKVGTTYVVLVEPMLRALGVDETGPESSEAEPVSSATAHDPSHQEETRHVDGRAPAEDSASNNVHAIRRT